MLKKEKQKEERQKDFYIDEQGNMVFTRAFLLRRGFCCGNGCKHCPYKENSPKLKEKK